MPSSPSSTRPWYRDWTQWVCPGPTRRFTAAELARGGDQPWPDGIDAYVWINLLAMMVVTYGEVPKRSGGLFLATFVVLGALALWVARLLWRNPSRKRMNVAIGIGALGLIGAALLVVNGLGRSEARTPFVLLLTFWVMTAAAWWFLTLYRAHQIEARLNELDARDTQLQLTRRLATAQIHPHFVFNTLASLTQWVETQDPRAAPLLRDFNAYLRATLPMFERERQPLAEELELVQRYLAIMQARLGKRLQVHMANDPALNTLQLPPGSLLTLVENAITHGIEPALRGGSVTVHSSLAPDGRAHIRVDDDGLGLTPPLREGLGLSNTRERLQALHGPGAELRLAPLSPQGCRAEMILPATP